MPSFTGVQRLVRRNDDTVKAVLVNGRTAWAGNKGASDLETRHGYGRVLTMQ